MTGDLNTTSGHRPNQKAAKPPREPGTLNPEPNEGKAKRTFLQMSFKSKQKAHLCRCAFMLISSLFLPAIPANPECKTKQKGPTIYMIDPF